MTSFQTEGKIKKLFLKWNTPIRQIKNNLGTNILTDTIYMYENVQEFFFLSVFQTKAKIGKQRLHNRLGSTMHVVWGQKNSTTTTHTHKTEFGWS